MFSSWLVEKNMRGLNESHSSFLMQSRMRCPSFWAFYSRIYPQEKLLRAGQMCHGVSCTCSDSGNPPGSPIARSGIIRGIIPLS